MRKLRWALSGAATVAALAMAAPAGAVTFTGSTTGCFGAGCTPGPLANVNGVGGLSFLGDDFSQSDANGFLAIGQVPDTFGYFTLGGTAANYNTPFTLLVSFTAPPGTNPPSSSFLASIFGSVINSNSGGVDIDFDNTDHLFSFTGGTFSLRLNDLSLNSNHIGIPTPVSGRILVAPIPEPATWAMMLLGFGAVGMSLRQRRRHQPLAQLA